MKKQNVKRTAAIAAVFAAGIAIGAAGTYYAINSYLFDDEYFQPEPDMYGGPSYYDTDDTLLVYQDNISEGDVQDISEQ